MELLESRATGLRCIRCGAEYPLNYLLECPRCQGLLELSYDLTEGTRQGPAILSGGALWRYAPFLPITDPAQRVSLGEGQTPLLEAPRLATILGVKQLLLKFEGSNPTGTVKDRSSATAVSAARQFGYRAISVVSTGNAGSRPTPAGPASGRSSSAMSGPRRRSWPTWRPAPRTSSSTRASTMI